MNKNELLRLASLVGTDSEFATANFINALDVYVTSQRKEARIDELELIKKNVYITETEDSDWPYWCETCHMMLEEKDDLCGCEHAIRSRLAELTNSNGAAPSKENILDE